MGGGHRLRLAGSFSLSSEPANGVSALFEVCVVDGHPDVAPLEVGSEGALLRIEGLDGAIVTSMGVEIFPLAALRKVNDEEVELREHA